jgi:F420-dependent oxidoreductase-like protein
MTLNYSGGLSDAVDRLADYEQAGLDMLYVPEAYSFDAVSQLGYIAARTRRLELASGILQIYTRTPSLTAMTAAGLDFVSGGRFTLGLGASGPQVIEGFHGVAYTAPLGHTRELVEICRQVWRREPVNHQGKHYQVPLPPGKGTGLGKPLKLINHPVRADIPIVIASIGPKNVELTAEIADGWQPLFYLPERAAEVWGEALAAGAAKRDPARGPLRVIPQIPFAMSDAAADLPRLRDAIRPITALYVGGMGARGKNFYNDLARRYGFEAEAARVQDLYLDGRKDEAAAALPDELLDGLGLIGSEGRIKERLAALAESGVTDLNLSPLGAVPPATAGQIERIVEMASAL